MLKTSAALIGLLCGWAFIGSCTGSSAEESATGGLASGEAPPLPKVSALAQPRPRKQVGLPERLTQAAIPKDNPLTPEKVALGEKLFFDSRLSADGTVACATCHDPARAFTDGRPVSIGIHGRAGQRNAPTILKLSTTRRSSGMAGPRRSKSRRRSRSSILLRWASRRSTQLWRASLGSRNTAKPS